MSVTAYLARAVHDGMRLHPDAALLVDGGLCVAISPARDLPGQIGKISVDGIICPAFVDLQVNGGGGAMFNDRTDASGLRAITSAHERSGTGALLPTLITDTPERTRAAVEAVARDVAAGRPAVAGLHLEGPHLAPARKGAHDAALIRPMDAGDLAFLCDAARRLPALMVTVAPDSVTPEQIARLSSAGVVVSLGHSDADYETCRAAFRAGARAVTHLFNAMSQMGHRAPGLVGAALDTPGIALGLIADGIHVHPAAIRIACGMRPDDVYLVTDAMAVAGTRSNGFTLNGRWVARADGKLTLEDGTLAGADLTMPRAIGVMTDDVGCSLETAIAMATGRPAAVIDAPQAGRLLSGRPARAVVLAGTPLRARWLPTENAPSPARG